jgi:hypothetical protein
MPERIEELRLIDESVDDLLVVAFPLEGPENPVPDDQNSGVILVKTISVGT